MTNRDQFKDSEFVGEFRQAMHYPEHGAAHRLRRVLADETTHSPQERASWLRPLAVRRARWPRTQGRRLTLVAVVVLMATGVALAATNITNLGKPTDTLPPAPAPVLDGF